MDIEREVFDGNDTSDLPEEFEAMTAAEIERRTTLLRNEVRVLREENQRLTSEQNGLKERIKENKEKIKLNNQLPYLVSNIVEVLEMNPENEDEEDGAAMDVDAQRQGVVKAPLQLNFISEPHRVL
jgi:26S proteasome regulatory subunit T5